MKKMLILGIMTLMMLSVVSAYTEFIMGTPSGWSDSLSDSANFDGELIRVGSNPVTIVNVTVHPSSNFQRVYIYRKSGSSGIYIANSTVGANKNASFLVTLSANMEYLIVGGSEGSAWSSFRNATTQNYPVNWTNDQSIAWINATEINWGTLAVTTYTSANSIVAIQTNSTSITNVTVNLTAPTNNSGFFSPSAIFNATISPSNTNLTNATIFVWFQNGTLFNQTLKTLSGSGVNNTFFNISNFGIVANYKWNVYACAVPNVCNFAPSNLTFSYDGVVNGNIYNTTTIELSRETFTTNVTIPNNLVIGSAVLWWNGTEYSGTTTTSGANILLSRTITIPSGVGTKNWFWSLTFTNGVNFNLSNNNQIVTALSIDNCATGTFVIYNFTMRDETTRKILNGSGNSTAFKIDLLISPYGTSPLGSEPYLNYSNSFNNTNPVLICLGSNINNTRYRTDIVASYSATGYVQKFYYADNLTLTNSTPNVVGVGKIDLHDLLLTDSTSFLFSFTDENNVAVPNVIVHTLRKYIGIGQILEVERSKQDNNGQTIVHLVEEDVIYQFNITQNGKQIFLSDEYTAKCIETPCSISLTAQTSGNQFPDPSEWFNLPNGTYGLIVNKTTRVVSLVFNLDESGTMNLSIYSYNGTAEIIVASGSTTATSGQVDVTVPILYGNQTFFAVVYHNNAFVTSQWVDLVEDGSTYYAKMGLLLAFLAILVIGAIGIDQGEFVLLWLGLGVVLSVAMLFMSVTWNVLMILFVVIGLIIYKISSRRRIK